MKKELLIFGAYGALGKGITSTLIKKNYDKIFLFDPHINDSAVDDNRVKNITVKNVSVEENVLEAFANIEPSKEKLFFLFSTVGGFWGGKTLWETGVDDWDKMLNVNLKTSFLIAKHFARLVKSSAGGSICFTTSMTAINAEKNKAAYSVSKSGLVSLVKALALEGKQLNLSVNAIAPYIIDTPSNRQWMDEADYNNWIKPEEVGELADAIFNNFHFITGNIFQLPGRFNI